MFCAPHHTVLKAAISTRGFIGNLFYFGATFIFTAAALLQLQSPLFAASIAKIDLKTDGNAEPPGDLLHVTVVSTPNEKPLRLETRAYLVSQDTGEVTNQVQAASDADRESEGAFVRKTELMPEVLQSGNSEIPVVIPYASLKLSPGDHTIGYVATLVMADRAVSQRPTRLTLCHVSKASQKRIITNTYIVAKSADISMEVSVLLPTKTTGEIIEKKVTRHDVHSVFEEQSRQFAIDVPGGFERTDIPAQILAWSTKNAAGIPETSHESNRPWAPHDKQPIPFATNRKVVSPADFTASRFGSDVSNEMSYGVATVNIPVEAHHRGELELPSSWKILWWKKRDPKKHFLLERIDTLTSHQFSDKLCDPPNDTSHDILLFIHGYNTTFEFACLRLAQVAYDTQFTGSPVVFSWPSKGTLYGYTDDEDAATNSAAQLGQLLIDLNACVLKKGKGRIHIIAHSMGNRVMLAAMSILAQHIDSKDSRIGYVVMAAPDVDLAVFVANFPSVYTLATSVSLYFCDKDIALAASQYIVHMASRLGQKPAFLKGLINIDASRADTSLLGHGYYASQSLLLIDIEEIFAGLKPDERPTIRRAVFTSPEIPQPNIYWLFP